MDLDWRIRCGIRIEIGLQRLLLHHVVIIGKNMVMSMMHQLSPKCLVTTSQDSANSAIPGDRRPQSWEESCPELDSKQERYSGELRLLASV